MASKQNIRLNLYHILSRAVEEGASTGVRLAFKHTDIPSQEAIIEAVENSIMCALCDVIEFDA